MSVRTPVRDIIISKKKKIQIELNKQVYLYQFQYVTVVVGAGEFTILRVSMCDTAII